MQSSTHFPRDLVVIRDPFSPLWVVRCRKPCGWGGRTSWCQDELPGLETCWLASSATQEGGERLRALLMSEAQGKA